MRTTDPPGALQEGVELAPPPPIGPDGSPQFEARRAPIPSRPRLCEAGPCRHYHRLEIQMDAENPRAQKVPVRLSVLQPGMEAAPDGTVYRAPAVYHTAVEHYCYPDLGIEMSLGAMPVVQCNRWQPLVVDAQGLDRVLVTHAHKMEFWKSPEGQQYVQAVDAWETARELEAKEALEAERLIAESLAAQQELARLDDLADQYTYILTSVATLSPGRLVERRRYIGQCKEFPSLSCTAMTEEDAESGIRDMIRTALIDMSRAGKTPPAPPPQGDETP